MDIINEHEDRPYLLHIVLTVVGMLLGLIFGWFINRAQDTVVEEVEIVEVSDGPTTQS